MAAAVSRQADDRGFLSVAVLTVLALLFVRSMDDYRDTSVMMARSAAADAVRERHIFQRRGLESALWQGLNKTYGAATGATARVNASYSFYDPVARLRQGTCPTDRVRAGAEAVLERWGPAAARAVGPSSLCATDEDGRCAGAWEVGSLGVAAWSACEPPACCLLPGSDAGIGLTSDDLHVSSTFRIVREGEATEW